MSVFTIRSGRTVEERSGRWREELLQALAAILTRDDDLAFFDERAQIVLRRDAAHVFIGFDFDEEENGYLVLSSPLVFLPTDDPLPIYRKLLELNNHELLLGRLAVSGDMAVLRFSLPVEGLSEETFTASLVEFLCEADFLHGDLSEEFGLKRFGFSG